MSKYHNKKVSFNGEIFDSKRELITYVKLLNYKQQGLIKDLKRQVPFILIPKQYETQIVNIRGKPKEKKVLLEQEVKYIADFTFYRTSDNMFCVVDSKGVKTKEYIIKRKLMLYIHHIKVIED